ncbi:MULTISPECIES: GNAT family N-acetyltransferase [Amycolatopsis]|uniref:GNAT family N-acetyltransferase n=1 Tax=Amycolatopsis eburnea TaxID=2267691 RepID=A0A3R9F6R7_9PSEU|nr:MULTISPECIES: GNAT family N-acetyltransferase [Amycolatopsis]NBH11945.1 GNAT family N-acetyltransferase [Amycolatopsis sp. SID8362]NED48636.1 GNAT family N-acetyltransferase [Amycolatopsis sp. SID8362]RSD13771.1 GNAT family N-acetyltransferase [Amycolatopsis eburnea]
MITIGGLTESDRATWENLFAGYNTFYGRTLPPERMDRAWREFAAGERMHALGARLDGELVGIVHFFTHVSTTSDDVCYLQDLFTDEKARGRGAGRALIEAVVQWARARGCVRVYWHTQTSNATARRLYDQVAVDKGFMQYQIPLDA